MTFSTVGVAGAGTMGRGIAIASLDAGLDVILVDVSEQVLGSARARIDQYFGRHPRTKGGPARGDLAVSTDLGALSSAGAVIEAVPELMDLKLEFFRRLRPASAGTLLASNTSTMSITTLAGASVSPAQVVGMHFFNPAHKMPLVEVVVGDSTSENTRDAAVDLARLLGKDPVVVRDVPGFVTSRLGLLLGTEAMRMVEEGVAGAADIDKAMRLGYGHPMGPLRLADLVGLDARLNNLRSMLERSGAEAYRPPRVLEDLVAEGHLGRKSGRGFFVYDAEGHVVGES
jgi:3-hydroxybutyryl-CoA dehydrogenase